MRVALNFDQVQKLSAFRNPDPSRHTVSSYTEAVEGVGKSNSKYCTGLHINQYLRDLSTKHESVAFRELLQNLLDELTRANGTEKKASYKGIEVVEGKRKNGGHFEDAICFHNGNARLAEIVMVDETTEQMGSSYYGYQTGFEGLPVKAGEYGAIYFINYGTVIGNMSQVLSIGNSGKHDIANQVGRHGEGLKTAILRLLSCGAGVEIYCCVDEWTSPPVAQRYRFFINTAVGSEQHGTLCIARSSVGPVKWMNKGDDEMRFQVKVYYNKRPYRAVFSNKEMLPKPIHFGFKMSDYLLSHSLIRNRLDDQDKGFVILNSAGRLYVWNFHVFDDPNWLAFSYNLFAVIGRDRNNLDRETLGSYVMGVWNAIFSDPKEEVLQRLFFDQIFCGVETKWLEYQFLGKLGSNAQEVLTKFYRDDNPLVEVPLLVDKVSGVAGVLPTTAYQIVSKEVLKILTGSHENRYVSLEDYCKEQSTKIIADRVATDVPSVITSLMPTAVIFKTGIGYHSRFVTQGEKVHVNWAKLSALGKTDDILNTLICSWLPLALGKDFDVTPMLRQTPLRVPVTVVSAVTPPPPPVVVIGKDDTEQAPLRKRISPEPPTPSAAVECPYPPIEGKKWRRVWTLDE